MRFEMKTRESHPIDKLELMAYLDGELPRERAAAAAAHLEECDECQTLAADLRGVCQEMAAWQVELSELEINPRIVVALEDHGRAQEAAAKKRKPVWKLWSRKRRWLVGGLATAAVLALVVAISTPNLMTVQHLPEFSAEWPSDRRSDYSPPPSRTKATQQQEMLGDESRIASTAETYTYDSLNQLQSNNGLLQQSPTSAPKHQENQARALVLPTGPMVIRTAVLALVSDDFDHARSKLEDILKRHHGYLGQLTAAGSQESARTLEATLRVPADQLDATISELKNLGRVDGESQKGEEVSQQYVDLQARLSNARETEQTLLDILRHRTGKLSDVLQVEQEIASVREEIERMEAEKKNMEKQVAFSTVNMKVTEDFKQHVHVVPDSTSTRLRNAAVDGYETMVAGLINVLLFFASAGPSILLWGAILFFPVRWVWKKWRQRNRI